MEKEEGNFDDGLLNLLLNEKDVDKIMENIFSGDKREQIENLANNLCVECEDQPFDLYCETCQDNFCKACFEFVHKKGTRKLHSIKEFQPIPGAKPESEAEKTPNSEMNLSQSECEAIPRDRFDIFDGITNGMFVERAKYIPLRATLTERKYLRLVSNMLDVSEYTDKVDILSSENKTNRIFTQIKEICSILTGLVVSVNYKRGQELLKKSDFSANQSFFQKIFCIARAYKIRCPEKMRESYIKLMHFLQDSVSPEISKLLEFSCVDKLPTVHRLLEKHGALDCLNDIPLLLKATKELSFKGKSRREMDRLSREKEAHFTEFCGKYSGLYGMPLGEMELAVRSISDNHNFLQCNRVPIDKMIHYLKHYFERPSSEKLSLEINYGQGGSRLSHGHKTQYAYALQTLLLWKAILNDFFKLWCMAEDDLLDAANYYRLVDTGQGLQRIQKCQRVEREMRRILKFVQGNAENWIGSSVVHLGDHNVPNSLLFIDKYTQVPMILNPVVITIERIPELIENPELAKMVNEEFGSAENLKIAILRDFFRHAFDGSGADNFYDAGSCIDGRLTSAWNWCSNIMKKKFSHVFLLTGFASFDGQWN